MTTNAVRVPLFGVEMDNLTMKGAIGVVEQWLDDERCGAKYVVTPNVDHIVTLQQHDGLRSAYQSASMVLADGFPLVVASRWLGKPLPERVAGSELIPALFDSLQYKTQRTTLYLLGAMPGVAIRAARRIQSQWPHIDVVGTFSPPFGFENDDAECESILHRINEVRPDLLVVGLGAPKQEIWTQRYQAKLATKVVFCVGATIDFLAGEKPQAPIWMRRSGLEWLHRVASEPRRLAARYAKGAWQFPQIVRREWLARNS